jgi:phosphoribosylanthranilate isomerase
MFRVKICGITSPEDAALAAAAGADAIGLNFYPPSPRFVDPQRARLIVAALPPQIVKVGLFVNAGQGEVCRTCEALGLDLVQLHGDEPPEYLRQITGRPVMRAFRIGREGLGPTRQYLAQCRHLGCAPRLVLLDSRVEGAYGGSGQSADWSVLSSYVRDETAPLVLAGGLSATNVAAAIAAVHPWAVDTASGVETSPGKKSAELVRRFVIHARQAMGLQSPLPPGEG